jgi:ferredoxin-type protein NapH
MRRQKIRKGLIVLSLLLFPVIINYLSPYIIIDGASHGIINGSFITFSFLFFFALFLGRGFCGWVCPGAGLQEVCFLINDKKTRGGKLDLIKYFIWVPWFSMIVIMVILVGGYHTINPLYLTEKVVSVAEPLAYINYYFVVGFIVILSFLVGKRSFCHYVCWMAPYMVIGRKIRNLFKWPALRLTSDKSKCIDCKTCTKNCPMSLNVNEMVQKSCMENTECILCGSCIDSCAQDVIKYSYSSGDRCGG